jgi:hypothetical protein
MRYVNWHCLIRNRGERWCNHLPRITRSFHKGIHAGECRGIKRSTLPPEGTLSWKHEMYSSSCEGHNPQKANFDRPLKWTALFAKTIGAPTHQMHWQSKITSTPRQWPIFRANVTRSSINTRAGLWFDLVSFFPSFHSTWASMAVSIKNDPAKPRTAGMVYFTSKSWFSWTRRSDARSDFPGGIHRIEQKGYVQAPQSSSCRAQYENGDGRLCHECEMRTESRFRIRERLGDFNLREHATIVSFRNRNIQKFICTNHCNYGQEIQLEHFLSGTLRTGSNVIEAKRFYSRSIR